MSIDQPFSEGGINVGQRSHRVRRGDSGFTLTELLIVIVILGVLTGIVVFAVGQFSDRGDISACKAAMKTTEVAVETYRANTGGLPADVDTVLVPAYLRTNPTVSGKYTITYYRTGRTGVVGLPDLPAGAVVGDLTTTAGSPVTDDCSA
jgi:prepilin-type N-terminal cleavage/methylation domain-containing protein